MSSIERKLKEEIEELERKSRSNPAEAATTPVVTTEDVKVEDPVLKETTDEDTNIDSEIITEDLMETNGEEEGEEEEDTSTTKTTPRTNWKKRYSTYKASTDATIFKLRQESIRVNEQNLLYQKKINTLEEEIQKIQASIPTEVLTDQEREILGDDAVTSMQKLMDAKLRLVVDPLKKQLQEERELRTKQQESAVEESRASNNSQFFSRLGELVPDYEDIDTNPRFLTWMREIEPESGLAREYLFKQAQSIGDVKRVASYFLNFKDPSKNVLDKYITPSKTSTNTTAVQKPKQPERMSMAFIDKFYDDAIRGRYKGRFKLQQEIEKKIEYAIANGLVA